MSAPSRSLPFLLRATGLAALVGLAAGAAPWEHAALASRIGLLLLLAAPWEHAALASRIGLLLLLAAPWLVVLQSAATDPGAARSRRPLSVLLLLAAAALVLVTVWAGRA
jgi:hypothetical protein